MRVQVSTTGLLGKYLPAGSARNRGTVELGDGDSVQVLLQDLGIPDDGRCRVILNGDMLPPSDYANTPLRATDEIVLMAPITAG